VQLSAVVLARVLAYVESVDLNPRGKIFYPDFIEEVVQRYKFQKFPKAIEDLDESKGVEFHEGKIGSKTIQKFTIFNTLLVLETRSNTSESKQILEEILTWGAAKLDLAYTPDKIKHFAYVSDVSFYSDVPLLDASPALAKLAGQTSEALSEIWKEPIQYEPTNLVVGHDTTARKYGIAPFTITRRAEAKFAENKYFSEAPLPTDVHLAMLKEFETEIRRLHDKRR
jgi:hypothetical protein